jgi:hypothetical protein
MRSTLPTCVLVDIQVMRASNLSLESKAQDELMIEHRMRFVCKFCGLQHVEAPRDARPPTDCLLPGVWGDTVLLTACASIRTDALTGQ